MKRIASQKLHERLIDTLKWNSNWLSGQGFPWSGCQLSAVSTQHVSTVNSRQFPEESHSVSLRDTDTVQVTGGGFDAVIVHTHTGKVFQNGGAGYRRFFCPTSMGLQTYVELFKN